MGILNVTPDSFSDGGQFIAFDKALRQVEQMIGDGAGIIDVGGESTRPGAAAVSEQQELDRVLPVITAIKERFDTLISIDTSKALVMQQAVQHGAGLINDVRALQEEGALAAAAATDVPICLMHMQGLPRTMQANPHYHDVVEDVAVFLQQRIAACELAGIAKSRLILDPGFGFGKTLAHNYQLLDQLDELHQFGLPLLVGLSRKSMLGKLLDNETDGRLAASVAAATISLIKGAQIVRVHDVKATADAVKVVAALHAYKEQIR